MLVAIFLDPDNPLTQKRELKALVKDAQPGDRFVFTCACRLVQLALVTNASVSVSGHSDQREQKLEDNLFPEEDGKDEIMLTIDGKEIRDNVSSERIHGLMHMN